MTELQTALHKGPWFMLHNTEALNIVLGHVRQLALEAVALSQNSVEDVFGKPDDIEYIADERDVRLDADLCSVHASGTMWEKQFVVLYCLWQYPGLLNMTKSYASQSVCIFFDTYFIPLMAKCMHGKNASIKQKGVKTEILSSALSPLESVQVVIKYLQLAHYHVGQEYAE